MKLYTKGLLLISMYYSTVAFAGVSVIVNPANNNAIAESEISRLFLGKSGKFTDGSAAIAVNGPKSNATRAEFEKKALNKSAKQVKAYWSKLMFSGKGKPPAELGSSAEMLKFIADNANAIGYVDSASVDSTVKVIKTY